MDPEKQLKSNINLKARKTSSEVFQALGKLPPQAIELEEAVLGALMLEKNALTAVVDILKPEAFYKEANGTIYKAIIALFSKGEPVDLLTVTNQLRSTGELEFVGGPYYITELTAKVNSAANVEYHARILVQHSIKRELIAVASEIHKEAYEDTMDVFDLLDKAEQRLFRVSETNIRKNYADMRSMMREAIDELQNKRNIEDGLTGIPCGFTAVDRMTSGWQRSDMVIIAARPGMGKTAFAVSALRNAAVDHRHAVAYFSLEMSAVQLVNRLISAEAELEGEKIRTGNLKDYEWTQLHHKITDLTDAPIFIDDTPALSVLELRAKCRRLKAQHNIELIVIDYLQLMTGDSSVKSGNREQEIASISRALKNIAKELNVPVLALSQLSRAVETRGGDKRPQLSDLRESGSIEQDADMVIFLYRPEYYGLDVDEEGNSTRGIGEVIIAKHRNGSPGSANLSFIGKFTKFIDLNSFDQPIGGSSGDTFNSTGSDTITLSSKINGTRTDDSQASGPSDMPF